jgi:hypothetical protein
MPLPACPSKSFGQTRFSPGRRPMPGWRWFNRCFLPSCPRKFQNRLPCSQHFTSGVWCLLGLSAEDSPTTSPPGHTSASTASRPRFTAMPACRCSRFSHLHIDLVGPLQYSGGCNFVFTVIDCTSKWMEAISLSDTSVKACAKALVFSWISRFGHPKQSLPIVGRNLLQIFGLSFVKCYTFRIAKQQHIILSQTVQSKDCIAKQQLITLSRMVQSKDCTAAHWGESLNRAGTRAITPLILGRFY